LTKLIKYKYKGHYYQSDSYFATDGEIWGSPFVPDEVKENIKANPEYYWLVNIDIHN